MKFKDANTLMENYNQNGWVIVFAHNVAPHLWEPDYFPDIRQGESALVDEAHAEDLAFRFRVSASIEVQEVRAVRVRDLLKTLAQMEEDLFRNPYLPEDRLRLMLKK